MKLKIIKRLWEFIIDNWDLMILLVTSFIAAVLSNLGKIPDIKIISSVILGALSLLAFSMTLTRMKFDKAVEEIKRIDFFNKQYKMYRKEVINYIENHHVKKAILIQYSGLMVKDIVSELVSNGVDVTLYVQSKKTAKKFTKHQLKRMENFYLIKTEFDEKIKQKGKGSLKLYTYDPPASVRVIKLDNKLLAIGWYAYKYVSKGEKKQYDYDAIKLKGHEEPGILLHSGREEYNIMNELVENLIKNFKSKSKLVWDLH